MKGFFVLPFWFQDKKEQWNRWQNKIGKFYYKAANNYFDSTCLKYKLKSYLYQEETEI